MYVGKFFRCKVDEYYIDEPNDKFKYDHFAFQSQKAFQPKLRPHKRAYYFLSNGPQFAHVGVFNRVGKLVSVSANPVTVQGVCLRAQRCGNVGMAKQTAGRLRLQLDFCLFGWFLYRHNRLTVNRAVRCFVRKGD